MHKYLLLLIISLLFFSACGPDKPQGLTQDVIMKEKQEVLDVIKKYNTAYANKDFAGLVDYMSQEVIFFGTDSAEVITSLAEYKDAMEKQWKLYDSMKYGEMVDVFVEMDRNATLASVIYGAPLELTIEDKTIRYFVRVHRTLKKENNQWLIVTGLVGIATTGQSTGDLLQMIEEEKNKNDDEVPVTEE